MSRYTWLLDNGHGGIDDNGSYTTCPNWTFADSSGWHKMYIHNNIPLYEGVFNRQIVDLISRKLDLLGISYEVLVKGHDDISLHERVDRANAIWKQNKNCIFVSIHGNAFNIHVRGFEIYTSVGPTNSDKVASKIAEQIERKFQSQTMRWDLSDGDKDKEAHFYVLDKTKMPAVLSENFFFDNEQDARVMCSPEGQNKIAQAHVNAILAIEEEGL